MRAALAFSISVAIAGACAAQDSPADTVFLGASIYTGVDDAPTADAVVVDEGRIVYVGAADVAQGHVGEDTTVIELGEAAMFPGFVDAHAHLIGIGLRETTLNLDDVTSIEDLQGRIMSRVQHGGEDEVIVGRGWIETHWPEGRFPTAADLDAVSGATPVILVRADGHALVANSAALSAAGVSADTPNPDGGEILRDETGAATGMLIDNAMDLVASQMTEPTGEARKAALRLGAEVYARRGWTGLHNMSVTAEDVTHLEALEAEGGLPIAVYNAVTQSAANSVLSEERDEVAGLSQTRAIKLYMDGALGSRGALLLEPYSDADGAGLQLLQRDVALALFAQAIEQNVQIALHAIGDKANRLALDWMGEALANAPEGYDHRWRIEHAQVVHPDDIARFAELGIIASMQPSHAIGDLHFAPARLGDDRLDGAYSWESLIDAGAIIAGGSDAPVEVGSPLIEFYAAVARRDLKGFQGDDWRAGEAVSRAEALNMFTSWPAYAAFQDDDLGTIEVGKRADFSVFSADLMTIPEADIPNQTAVMTVVAGEIVFDGRM